ncbi:MAG: DegV family protein [Acidimicrobiales bacterium]
MTVRVVSDSACDLPEEVVTGLGIGIVPLRVRFGSTELVDREQLSTKDFWSMCSRSAELPQTTAPSPGAFREAFLDMARQGASGVVCVTLSSRLSATNEAAVQAARGLQGEAEVEVVDSLSATMGEGLVVMAAAEAAAQGADIEAVVGIALSTRSRLSAMGAIATLENLRKGGRIGGAAAALGGLLSVKPVIEVRGGVVEQESRQRTRAKSLRYLVDKVRAAGPLERLAAMDADAEDFEMFVDMLAGTESSHPLVLSDIGPVVGTHTGRGTIGVAWVTMSEA